MAKRHLLPALFATALVFSCSGEGEKEDNGGNPSFSSSSEALSSSSAKELLSSSSEDEALSSSSEEDTSSSSSEIFSSSSEELPSSSSIEASSSSLSMCDGVGYDAALKFCLGNALYDKCGDKNGSGKHEYNPETQFCHNNYTVDKCGGLTFVPPNEQCSYGVVEKKCGAGWYDAKTHFCLGGITIAPLCGDKEYESSQFCSGGKVYDKCNGTVEYNLSTEQCCGNSKFTKSSQFCLSDGIHNKCNGKEYVLSEFCYGGNIYEKCENYTLEYNPETEDCCADVKVQANKFCWAGVIYDRCGNLDYNPRIETCCSSNKLATPTQFCFDGNAYNKCGGYTYNPISQFCEGDIENGIVYSSCGGSKFNVFTHFCYWGTIYEKCENYTLEYNPETESCCADVKVLANQFCWAGVIYDRCGNLDYNPRIETCCSKNKLATPIQFCFDGNAYNKCGGYTYNPISQFCEGDIENGKIYSSISYGGRSYKTISIGTQTWMAENLDYDASGSKCYGNNDFNCVKYGRLYSWDMAQTACPIGWRLPTTADWQTLINYAGGENAAGTKLKAIEGWNDNGNGSDDFGFSALPAGAVSPSNEFCDAGSFGWWWRAKNSDEGAAVRMVSREVTSTSSSTLVTLAKRVETTQHATATIITDNVSADNYTPLNRNNTFYLAVRCIKN